MNVDLTIETQLPHKVWGKEVISFAPHLQGGYALEGRFKRVTGFSGSPDRFLYTLNDPGSSNLLHVIGVSWQTVGSRYGKSLCYLVSDKIAAIPGQLTFLAQRGEYKDGELSCRITTTNVITRLIDPDNQQLLDMIRDPGIVSTKLRNPYYLAGALAHEYLGLPLNNSATFTPEHDSATQFTRHIRKKIDPRPLIVFDVPSGDKNAAKTIELDLPTNYMCISWVDGVPLIIDPQGNLIMPDALMEHYPLHHKDYEKYIDLLRIVELRLAQLSGAMRLIIKGYDDDPKRKLAAANKKIRNK